MICPKCGLFMQFQGIDENGYEMWRCLKCGCVREIGVGDRDGNDDLDLPDDSYIALVNKTLDEIEEEEDEDDNDHYPRADRALGDW